MKTLAYVNGEISVEQYRELLTKNVTSILIDLPGEDEENQISNSLNSILMNLERGDELIIYDLTNLHRTLSELSTFFKKIKEKEINLTILNKEEIFGIMTDAEFVEFIFDLNEENKKISKEQRDKTINKTKNVGRPKMSEENIKKIRRLRLEKKLSLKETAELCGVSVGTVYKYTNQESLV